MFYSGLVFLQAIMFIWIERIFKKIAKFLLISRLFSVCDGLNEEIEE